MGIYKFLLQHLILLQVGSVFFVTLLIIMVGEMMYQKEKREKRKEKEQF